MAEKLDKQQAFVRTEWPQPAAGAPEPRVLADESSFSLLFRSQDDSYVVFRFPLCTYLVFGAPNDEAFEGHPLSRFGLRYYSVHEVIGSELIKELERRNSVHPRHDRELYLKRRHFVFTFQDSMLECVVPADERWSPTVSVFGQLDEAEKAWRATTPA
jgi:hypothetical protein